MLRSLRGVFVGSGSEGMQAQAVCDAILRLTGKRDASDVSVCYLGTATYDAEAPRRLQTMRLAEAGAAIHALDLCDRAALRRTHT